MVIVSDTTALSTLYLIGRLDWLPQLFGQVFIPPSVNEELQELIRSGYDLKAIESAEWLVVQEVKNQAVVMQLHKELDLGESEAIALALEVQADYLLIDERKGSQRALELGVPTIGLLRVILELKLRRIIPKVKTVLDEMRETGGFWMGEALYQRVLEAAGE